MRTRLARDDFRRRLLETLARTGPASAALLCRQLGVSQPTFSRRLAELRDDVLVAGRGRATRYAARRVVQGVPAPVAVYELGADANRSARLLLHLHPVEPSGFYAAPAADPLAGEFHEGLPWFLHDIRPAGFLGRLVPLRHPSLDVPRDISLWSAEDVLRYVTLHGWDLPGAFLLGEGPQERLFAEAIAPSNAVHAEERERCYPASASDVLNFGPAGSSAAGEQPKFLATRREGEALVPVLVKFSPAGDDPVSRRVADLLVAEHLALETMRAAHHDAAFSALLVAGGRTFLEVERFDRSGLLHRRGVVSLLALDLAFVGSPLRDWTASVRALAERGVLPHEDVARVRWRQLFGQLIGDTDQHFGNLSFGLSGTEVTSLAPAYDVLPSHYAPRGGELSDAPHRLPSPGLNDLETTLSALGAAESFWQRVTDDDRISDNFRGIADGSRRRLAELARLLRAL